LARNPFEVGNQFPFYFHLGTMSDLVDHVDEQIAKGVVALH
jgi:hypothetical protein